jgi:hypothetical protein
MRKLFCNKSPGIAFVVVQGRRDGCGPLLSGVFNFGIGTCPLRPGQNKQAIRKKFDKGIGNDHS